MLTNVVSSWIVVNSAQRIQREKISLIVRNLKQNTPTDVGTRPLSGKDNMQALKGCRNIKLIKTLLLPTASSDGHQTARWQFGCIIENCVPIEKDANISSNNRGQPASLGELSPNHVEMYIREYEVVLSPEASQEEHLFIRGYLQNLFHRILYKATLIEYCL
ncbi:hypothetical protein FF38_06856 [Lucilia cuprina]|uniref:Uncharacterized protein n=1 Tax=Lucilia cuprina TaxID=7375 RepID=A0A0L0CMM5_LUCCU|nr:hypothetical protein FF38_06856 [Lucilia cuprina]